jgi:type IV secretory pathway VirD2 relaxase
VLTLFKFVDKDHAVNKEMELKFTEEENGEKEEEEEEEESKEKGFKEKMVVKMKNLLSEASFPHGLL